MKKFESLIIVLIVLSFIASLFIQGEMYKGEVSKLEDKLAHAEVKHRKLKTSSEADIKASTERLEVQKVEYKKLEEAKAKEAKALNKQVDELSKKVDDVQGQLDSKTSELDKMKSLGFGRGGGDAVASVPSSNAKSIIPHHNSSNLYSPGYCTWHLKSLRPELPNNLGNANQWASRASAMGFSVGSEPSVGAVAATTRGYYGHVGYVKAVEGDRVLISEMNAKGLWVVSEDWYSKSQFEAYIY